MIDLSDPRIDFNNIIWIQNEWKMFNYGLEMLNYRDRIHMVNTITVKSNDLSFFHKRPSLAFLHPLSSHIVCNSIEKYENVYN